nr:hypothetical protein [Cupriavidus gilardii]
MNTEELLLAYQWDMKFISMDDMPRRHIDLHAAGKMLAAASPSSLQLWIRVSSKRDIRSASYADIFANGVTSMPTVVRKRSNISDRSASATWFLCLREGYRKPNTPGKSSSTSNRRSANH